MSNITYVDGWPQPYKLLDAIPYWEALQEQRLTYQRCRSCTHPVWPAHSRCPHCGSDQLTWEESAGRGTVYSFSTVMRGPSKVWQELVHYTVGFVQMAEGYFLFTQFDTSPQDLHVGKPVQVQYVRRGNQVIPTFC